MGDDPVPRATKGHKHIRNFITSTLLMAVMSVETQNYNVSTHNSDNDPKTKITIGVRNITALTHKKDKICSFNNFFPYFIAHTDNMHSNHTEFLGKFGTETVVPKNNMLCSDELEKLQNIPVQFGMAVSTYLVQSEKIDRRVTKH